jgi:hypothetical protein
MAKKHVEIEIIDKELEEVTTGGGVNVVQTNNIPNSQFGATLNTSNVGKSGCDSSQNFIEYNFSQTGGTPIDTNLKPCSFNTSGSGLTTVGNCINFRETQLPNVVSSELVFPSTVGGGVMGTSLVNNGDFEDSVGNNQGDGFIDWTFEFANNNYDAIRPWHNAMTNGSIDLAPSATNIANDEYWYAASSQCYSYPLPYGAMPVRRPEINPSGAFLKLFTNSGYVSGSLCALATVGYCGVWQVIQGLVPGQTYDIGVKFKSIPAGGTDWGFGWGSDALDGGQVYGGDTYINLGGDSAPLYDGVDPSGNATSSRAYYGTESTDYYNILPKTTAGQTTTFTSQGGNEVLMLRWKAFDSSGGSSVLGDVLELDYITITPQPTAPFNASSVYSLVTAYDNNAGAVPTSATLKFDFVAGDNSGNGIAITISDPNIDPPTGLQRLTNPMVITNNYVDGFIATHPIAAGMNTITIPINGNSSSGAFNANDRLFTFTVFNPQGPQPGTGLNPTFASIDIEYNYTTVPTTYTQVNPAKSVVGLLEVSNSEDFPLNISYTVSDGKNLDARFGDYSQTFDLPATANNNRILNHIWKSNVDQSDKKLFGVKECRVLVNGIPFFDGMMQVKSSEHKGAPESYSCTLYGGNFSWMSTLKDKNLCEVFDHGETFTFDYVNIENTFLQTQDTTHIQYPLISRKDFNYSSTNTLSLQNYVNLRFVEQYPDWQPAFYVKNIIEKIFTNIGYKIESNFMDTNHFKRLLSDFPFLKNDSQNSSNNFSCHVKRPHMDNQLLAENVLLSDIQTSSPDGDEWYTIKLNQSIDDPSGTYNSSTGVWTCALDGVYDMNVINGAVFVQLNGKGVDIGPNDYTFNCKNSSPNDEYWNFNTLSGVLAERDAWGWSYRVKVTNFNTGIVSFLPNGNSPASMGWAPGAPNELHLFPFGNLSCFNHADYLPGNTHPTCSQTFSVGDTMELQVGVAGVYLTGTNHDEPYVDLYCGYDNTWPNSIAPELMIAYSGTEPFVGDTIKLNEILPCDVTQIDYIKSISHLFNLYFTTDVQAKKVYIEPFNEFFKPTSEGVNWDNIVDYSQPINDDYDIGLKRDLIIKYKTDSADKYAEALNNKSNIWGEENRLYNYKETLGEDYESGEVVLENPLFASTTQVWDNDAHDNPAMDKSPVLIPCIWKDDAPWSLIGPNNVFRPSEIIEAFVPRIYYYAWEGSSIGTSLPSGLVTNSGVYNTYVSFQWNIGLNEQDGQWYPRATFVDWEESLHKITQRPSLSFSDQGFTAPGNGQVNKVPGLYRTYYKNMIEQLKKAPRIRTVSVNLKLSDILNLDIRKLVYLDESWWRINRIVEFSPAKNLPTKVELIQWLDVGFWPIYEDNTLIKYT